MTHDDAKKWIDLMRSEGVSAFEVDGMRVVFSPLSPSVDKRRQPVDTTNQGAEATPPQQSSPKPVETFQGMELDILLASGSGVDDPGVNPR